MDASTRRRFWAFVLGVRDPMTPPSIEPRAAADDARATRAATFDDVFEVAPARRGARPSLDAYYLSMARLAASRATCRRRAVGCVLVDGRGRVLSIGYNGAPSGFPHCLDVPCPGADLPSGQGLDLCEAVHAEQSALVACRDLASLRTAYCTTAPCVSCTKLLLNTPCVWIVFDRDYPEAEAAERLWLRAGRRWMAGAKSGVSHSGTNGT